MRLFSEKVVPTFTSSNLNILTVEDYNEIFFDVFEFEINGKKFIAEKVSDYKGSPVVNIPLVLEGEEFMSSFVLQRGKFEVLFNKANSTFTGPAVQEAEESIIQIVEQEEEVEDIVLEKKETILKEIQQARQTAKQMGKETRLFSEKVIPTFTSSDINILTVKDYSEIFFDVFEFEINSKKFIAEKVSDYKGSPVIDIPLVLEGKEFTASFVLQRGEFEILFNKSNATFVRTAVHESTEPIIQFVETENEIEDIVFEKKETILKEIQQARQTAERYVKELKQQKVRETTKFFDDKQQILDKEISESKKSLLDEFLSLVENVKSEFYEFNESEKTKLVSFIKESLDSLSDDLSKDIEDKNEQAEKVFSEKINELATNVLSGVLLKEIDSNNKKTNKDITSRFEAITTSLNKLTEQRDSRLKGEMKEIIDEYSGSLNGLEQANVELNNLINKSNNKALSRIGNVKTQLEESILYTGNDLKSTITNTKEELLDKIQFTENKIDAVEKTADIITNKFTVVESTVNAAKDEINAAVDIVNNSDAKLDTVRTELQESIHNISDLISTDIKKDITKLKKDLTEQISITEDKVDLTGKNTTLVEQEVHVLKRTVDKSAADTDDRFNALIHNVDANVVSVDNKIKSVSKNITEQLGVVNTSIDRLTVKSISLDSNIKELEDKIILAEDNIITFYDERINLVETKVTDLTEENKQYFINLIEESKQTLLEQISNIKVDVPNIIVEQSNGSQEVDLKGVKSELEKIIGTKFTTEISALKRLIEMSSGGGSVAVQFANGGTMNGNLNVTGQILSGGIDIAVLLSSGGDDIAVNTIVRSSSGNWNSTYATVSALSSTFAPITLVQSTSALLLTRSDYSTSSATFATTNFVNSKFFPISGGTITGDTLFNNNVTIFDNLTVVGTISASQYLGIPTSTSTSTDTLSTVTGRGNTTTDSIIVGGVNTPYVTFDTAAAEAGAIGKLKWNNEDGTLDLGLKGGNVTLQVGQEAVVRVVNKTGSNLLEANYQVARIRTQAEGGSQGQRLAIVLAQADNDAHSVDTLGLVTENIDNNQEGFVTTSGLVRGVNTTGSLQGETWSDGDVVYLSPTVAGRLTNIKPQAPQHTVIVGFIVYHHQNNGKIFVKVDNGYELDELHNVKINGVTNNSLLSYNSLSGVWKNTNSINVSTLSATSLSADRIYTTQLNALSADIAVQGNCTIQGNVQSSGSLTIAGNSALLGTTIATGKVTANGQGALSTLGANDVITAYNKKFLDMSARECYLVRFNQAGGSQTNTQYAFTHGTLGWGSTPLSGDAGIHAEFTIPNILTHGVNISSNTAGGGAALDWRVDHILSISISTPLDSTARDIIIRAVFGNPVTFGTNNAKLGALQSVPGYGLRISKNSITNTYDLKMVGRTVFFTDNMTGATNTTPITATSVRHGLVNGDLVEVTNVGGNIGANGIFTVSGIVSGGLSNTFILSGSVGTGTYTSGGAVQKITSETLSLNPYTFYRFFFKWNATTKTVTLHLGSPDEPASLMLSGIGIFRPVAFYQTAAQMRIGMFSVTANTAFLSFNYDTPKIMIL